MQPSCLIEGALMVLQQPDPWMKARLTERLVGLWRAGELDISSAQRYTPPLRPARSDDLVKLVEPRDVRRLGKGGTLESRQLNLHSMAHIESWAVDLSWDIIARFGQDPSYALPRDFFDDFVRVAEEESKHFCMLAQRLKEVGSQYGAFTAHDGLWETAMHTAHSLPARLAVEHCVHEARGLDVLPATIAKFGNNSDRETAALLQNVIYPDEISHCAAGIRWLRHLFALAHSQDQAVASTQAASSSMEHAQEPVSNAEQVASQSGTSGGEATSVASGGNGAGAGELDWMAQARRHASVESWFHELVRAHFKGALKPPFNTAAREQAGFDESWYLPLVEVPADRKLMHAS